MKLQGITFKDKDGVQIMKDYMAYYSAFFDRMHFYLPDWEIPKMRPELITDSFGFITDYLSE